MMTPPPPPLLEENVLAVSKTSGEAKHLDSITALIQWKRHMEVIKSELLELVHTELSCRLDKALEEVAHSFPQRLRKCPAQKQSRKKGPLLEKQKVFVDQRSLLDELLEVEHFCTIYHIFVAMFCVFALSTVVVYFIDEERLVLDFKVIMFAFGQLPRAFFAWLCMFLYTLLVPYKALQMWASSLRTVKFPRLFTIGVAVALLVCHVIALGFYPIYTIIHYRLGPASRSIVVIEQIRFLMKSYSFIRESVPLILCVKSEDGKKKHPPEFSTYLYFLFCPTLIYRESYPRTPYVRWKYVINNFAKFLWCLFYLYFIVVRLCIPIFTEMSKQPLSTKTLVLSIFNASLPGLLLMLLGFFAFLHCWLNAFAEMLRFADRMFYKDWWNSTSFRAYFRTWNMVVHDWLYYYIYQDLLWLFKGQARVMVMLSTIIFSAIAHEYTFTLCLGFFYPVILTIFVIFGGLFNIVINDRRSHPAWNILLWACFYLGYAIQICLYCQEWYARVHCPVQERTFWSIVIPHSWSCHS